MKNALTAIAAVAALLFAMHGAASAGIVEDLRSIGVPALSATVLDTAVVIGIEGSLVEGDTLLKRYGGVVFTVVDSILSGWPVKGICVDIPGSRLRLTGSDLDAAIVMMGEGCTDDRTASWILDHTRVFHFVE